MILSPTSSPNHSPPLGRRGTESPPRSRRGSKLQGPPHQSTESAKRCAELLKEPQGTVKTTPAKFTGTIAQYPLPNKQVDSPNNVKEIEDFSNELPAQNTKSLGTVEKIRAFFFRFFGCFNVVEQPKDTPQSVHTHSFNSVVKNTLLRETISRKPIRLRVKLFFESFVRIFSRTAKKEGEEAFQEKLETLESRVRVLEHSRQEIQEEAGANQEKLEASENRVRVLEHSFLEITKEAQSLRHLSKEIERTTATNQEKLAAHDQTIQTSSQTSQESLQIAKEARTTVNELAGTVNGWFRVVKLALDGWGIRVQRLESKPPANNPYSQPHKKKEIHQEANHAFQDVFKEVKNVPRKDLCSVIQGLENNWDGPIETFYKQFLEFRSAESLQLVERANTYQKKDISEEKKDCADQHQRQWKFTQEEWSLLEGYVAQHSEGTDKRLQELHATWEEHQSNLKEITEICSQLQHILDQVQEIIKISVNRSHATSQQDIIHEQLKVCEAIKGQLEMNMLTLEKRTRPITSHYALALTHKLNF